MLLKFIPCTPLHLDASLWQNSASWRRRRRRRMEKEEEENQMPLTTPAACPWSLIPGTYKDKLPWSSVKTKGERTHAVTPDIEADVSPTPEGRR